MNDRILGALQRVGIQDSPVASLDHDNQFFALTAQALLYQGETGGPLHQVKLREISRIHSDHQGTLRVEAPSGTAITASLLGFDPNRVQRFFQTVRDTTARAKQLPASPLPTTPSESAKTFSPEPVAPALIAPAPDAPGPLNLSPVNPAPASTAPRPATAPAPVNSAPVNPATPIVIADGPEAPRMVKIGAPPAGLSANPAAASTAPAQPAPSRPELSKPEPIRLEPTRIEAAKPLSVSASPTFNQPRNSEPPKATTPAPSLPPSRLPVSTPAKPAGPATSAAPTTATSPNPSSQDLPSLAAAPATALERSLQSSSLVRSAQTVGGLSMTVRILSVVLILGALGMGYFLWRQGRASQIPALWTVTMGIVTAVALNVLAEVLKLLAALGQTVASSKE